MTSRFKKVLLIFIAACTGISLVFAWGSWGHKHISRAAVFALPQGMQQFYYNHIDFLTEASVVPDLRRALINDKNEGPRHYVDMEDFGNLPVDSFPKTSAEAYQKYDSNFLNKTGYLPWYIQNITEKLTNAFKKRNKSEILFLSAELCHYVSDAHVPLHTSSNHDGQKTNQKGIHALWESTLPQMFGENYNFKVAPAVYFENIPAATWNIISRSHSLVDTLLAADKSVRGKFTGDNMYKKDSSGKVVMFYSSPVFSDEYAREFHQALKGMQQQQLRSSIHDVASYWYTAWVNAGSPNLLSLDDPHLTRQNRKNYKKELKAWNKGHLLNLSIDKE